MERLAMGLKKGTQQFLAKMGKVEISTDVEYERYHSDVMRKQKAANKIKSSLQAFQLNFQGMVDSFNSVMESFSKTYHSEDRVQSYVGAGVNSMSAFDTTLEQYKVASLKQHQRLTRFAKKFEGVGHVCNERDAEKLRYDRLVSSYKRMMANFGGGDPMRILQEREKLEVAWSDYNTAQTSSKERFVEILDRLVPKYFDRLIPNFFGELAVVMVQMGQTLDVIGGAAGDIERNRSKFGRPRYTVTDIVSEYDHQLHDVEDTGEPDEMEGERSARDEPKRPSLAQAAAMFAAADARTASVAADTVIQRDDAAAAAAAIPAHTPPPPVPSSARPPAATMTSSLHTRVRSSPGGGGAVGSGSLPVGVSRPRGPGGRAGQRGQRSRLASAAVAATRGKAFAGALRNRPPAGRGRAVAPPPPRGRAPAGRPAGVGSTTAGRARAFWGGRGGGSGGTSASRGGGGSAEPTSEELSSWMTSDWTYMTNDGMPSGPHPWSRFKTLFKLGRVPSNARVLGGDFDDFVRLSDYPALVKALRIRQ